MKPRHRSPAPAAAPALQVHLHVQRLLLDNPTAAGVPAADLPAALQAALGARLAGQQPPVNHSTVLDRLAQHIVQQVQPASLGSGPSAGPLPSRPAIPSGAEPGHEQSGGLFVPGEERARLGERGLQGRTTYPSDEGSS